MKKKKIKNLILSKKTVFKFNKNKVNGGGTMSTTPGCATGNNPSAIIVCMEDYTLGCVNSLPGWC